ncbi:MAG: STAS domain-containing protein [Phycisphaerae bacterium]|nr:STAS domain-containing protein [Phycisphaerae bacterium]
MEQGQSYLKIEHSLDETFVTINVPKLLDEDVIKEIQTCLLGIVDSGKHHKMLLNFSEVAFLSSSFLGTLIKVLKRVREKNGELTLINIGPNILKVFKITQLDKVFTIV